MEDTHTDPRTRRGTLENAIAAHSGAYVRQRAAEIALSAQQRARLTDDPVVQSDLREVRRLALLLVGIGNLASTLPQLGRIAILWRFIKYSFRPG